MDQIILHAQTRTQLGNKVKQLRREGKMPGVTYGHDAQNQSITIDALAYEEVFKQAGTSTLVDLVIDENKPIKVLLHEPQHHPVKKLPLHADFYVVKMTEKLQTTIPLHFEGVAEAVDVLDGSLTVQIDELDVECFPDKLVPQINVDITSLKTFDDLIRVGDITAPEGIEILQDPEEVVASITPPRSEEELAELEEAPTGADADAAAVSAVEVEAKGKEEESDEAK